MRSRVADATARKAGSKPQRANTEYFSTSRTGGTGARRQGQRAWRMGLAALTMLALVSFGLASPSPARAATSISTTDITKCDYNTLSSAEANAASGDTLQFGCDGVIYFDATFTINKTLTIDGNGHKVTLDGGGARRLFVLQRGGDLTLDGVTIHLGSVGPGKKDEEGGAIYNPDGGTLTIKNSTFSNNYANGASGSHDGYGGAIYSANGTLTIENSAFLTNTVEGGTGSGRGDSFGGAVASIGGTLKIINSTFSGNLARGHGTGYGYGGAVYVERGANVSITDSTFVGNVGSGGGGGVENNSGDTLTITDSAFVSNVSSSGGGGGVETFGGALTITDSAFVGNSAHNGGGIKTFDSALTISGSTLVGNVAGEAGSSVGGGVESTVSAHSANVVSITNSAFIANAALGNDGTSRGGGVNAANGIELHITNSTFIGNLAGLTKTSTDPTLAKVVNLMSAFDVSAGGGGKSGLGLSVNIGQVVGGVLALFGVGERNGSSGYGGGVNIGGAATITNSTFTANQTVGSAGLGGGVYSSGSTTLMNSIVAGNASDTPGSANCSGYLKDGGYNLTTWDGECGTTSDKHDVWTANPGLASFDNNGGSTPTLVPLGSSVAVDQIPRGVNGCGASGQTDQRGYIRPQGDKCDIGAVELDNAPPITTVALSPKANGTYTANVKVTLSGGNDAGGSGVKATYYKLDNGAQQTYTTPFTITSNGQHTLTYWSVDTAGNTEIAKAMTIKLDKTPYLLYIGLGLAGLVIVGLIVTLVFWRRKRRSGGASGERRGSARVEGGGGSSAPIEEPRVPVLR